MPLIDTFYTKTAAHTPSNATAVSYFWEVDGTIVSGQGTNSITYIFDSPGTRNITLTTFNSCSSQTFTQSYVVCQAITGLQINGPSALLVGSNYTFTATAPTGIPINANWTIDNNVGTIVSGQGTDTLVVHIHTDAPTLVIDFDATDCDGNFYNTTRAFPVSPSCIPIISCSF